jgi:hypothetical protein
LDFGNGSFAETIFVSLAEAALLVPLRFARRERDEVLLLGFVMFHI